MHTGIVLRDLVQLLENLMVREVPELVSEEVSSQSLDRPNDDAGFEVERLPMSFRAKGSAGDVDNRPRRTVGLFVF